MSQPAQHRLPTRAAATAGTLLAVPVLALLVVGLYADEDPHLWGFPFFYWYQLAWVFLASAFTYAAYRVVERARSTRRTPDDRPGGERP
jgi:hypothetical protein